MKIVLPLVALGLLSTIFLFARDSDPTGNVPIATREGFSDRASEMVTAPFYSGATGSGALLTLKAAQARPDPEAEGRALAVDVEAAMAWPDGSRVDLAAPAASLDGEQSVRLTGGVRMRSSQGYRMQTDALTAAMDRVAVESDGRVDASGPVGEIEAGRMRIEESAGTAEEDADLRLLFTDGVRVIYRP
ncbi:LPS export ABC transporter periplasmic protein LptC [Roseivivax sp. CAU 1761]